MNTITLATLNRIKKIFEDENRSLTRNYISTEYKINFNAVKIAISELLKVRFLKKVDTPYRDLYGVK